jgi:tetratricopeptide (TPR) repeat protein
LTPVKAALAAIVFLGASPSLAETLDGRWVTPLGTLALTEKGDSVAGSLERAVAGCPLQAGAQILKADVLEDSVSGELLLCLTGCGKSSDWVPTLLLLSADGQRLSGALTIPKGCKPAVATPSAFVALRPTAASRRPPARPKRPHPTQPVAASEPPDPGSAPESPEPVVAVRPAPNEGARKKAHEIADDGAQYLSEGRFEKARARFQEAVKLDPTYAEGYNGIGATYRARNDLGEALRWYKRSVQADPTIGDPYYNMACVYALEHKRSLALRYLKMARRNGYVSGSTMQRDEDLASLRSDKTFQSLLEDE